MASGSSQRHSADGAEALTDDDNLNDLSPTDGYFNALPPLPQEMLVPDPEQENTPAAKEQEAREEQEERARASRRRDAASSSRRDHSVAASSVVSASSRRSIDTTAGEADRSQPGRPRLPTYDDAIAERPYLGPPIQQGNSRTYRTMSSPSEDRAEVPAGEEPQPVQTTTESQPLLPSNADNAADSRRGGWRGRCFPQRSYSKGGRNFLKKLLLALIVLCIVAMLADMIKFVKHADRDKEAPYPTPSPAPSITPSPTPPVDEIPEEVKKFCPRTQAQAGFMLEFIDPGDFQLAQVAYPSPGRNRPRHVRQSGRINLVEADGRSGQDFAPGVRVRFNVYASNQELVRMVSLSSGDHSLLFEVPIDFAGTLSEKDELCMYTVAHVMVASGTNFTELVIGSDFMDIAVHESLSLGMGTRRLNLTSLVGSISTPPSISSIGGLHARDIYLHTQSGLITGTYPLYDSLKIITTAGLIDVNITLHEIDPYRPKPANLVISSVAGQIRVVEPVLGDLRARTWTNGDLSPPELSVAGAQYANISVPARDYRTDLHSTSGGIEASLVHGSKTEISGSAGVFNISLAPYGDEGRLSAIELQTTASIVDFFLGRRVDQPTSLIENLNTAFHSVSGGFRLAFPPTWEGKIEGTSFRGGIRVDWPGFRTKEYGKDPFRLPFVNLEGYVGKGSSRIEFETVSGSTELVGYNRTRDTWEVHDDV